MCSLEYWTPMSWVEPWVLRRKRRDARAVAGNAGMPWVACCAR